MKRQLQNGLFELLAIGLLVAQTTLDWTQATVQCWRRHPRACSALVYLFLTMAFCYQPSVGRWIGGFVMMSLPVAMLSGLVASLYLLRQNERLAGTVGLVWLVLTLPIGKRLFGYGNELPATVSAQALSVLSFNGECFNPAANTGIRTLRADIACFQEYAPNADLEKQYPDRLTRLTRFSGNRQVGLALFSQYPIVRQYGRIWKRGNAPDINGFLCADVAYGRDTVRVVNVHLWSMGVRVEQAYQAGRTGRLGRFFAELGDTFQRLKEGFDRRDEQIREVEQYVSGSRYPVIICGDFNETPFGYAYGKLRRNFRNAFEEAGEGFGFTLNRHPYCVRIDQQFFSPDWHVTSCRTLSGVTFSDHFPVMAQYILKKSLTRTPEVLAQR
ncbi:endonuclease/exonuclease/phosphatase family metal-dependent hydrolase [Spirosoma oryzae]|uniref:Endonuclease/exonuclease/phosphatase family metal-dependent hydrolase n=1 Tax=Spirosoma oryzae TaxID=1469603 RepID=A0A2T0TN09_9BACT|nr:endonuclease/exonuclease/phosphatase family protein [Spirosoma oryzae]PRY47011.1 endonuclease/exonuclease/phosphatase family metal-dependent hydrolase [Spirosoma oryzae]